MKFWRQMPYWLRGGVIGVVIVLVSSALSTSCLEFFIHPNSWGLECLPFYIPTIPIIYTMLKFPAAYSFSSISILLIEITAYFILGSLAGVLFGYIKSRRKSSTPQV